MFLIRNTFYFLVAITLLTLVSCGKDDDLNVVLNSSGSTVLTFTNGDTPFPTAEIRVSNFNGIGSNFQSNNLFEGELNEQGAITIGPLNPGSYYFRVDLGSQGFFTETFEVISGSTSARSFDLIDYSSKVELTATGLSNFTDGSFYLVSTQLRVDELEASEISSFAALGVINEEVITFDEVIMGSYRLVLEINDNLVIIPLTVFNNVIEVERDYDYEEEISIPADLVLQSENLTIQQTTEDQNSEEVEDVISSVSFNETEYTINFQDGSSHTGNYRAYTASDQSITVSLNNTYIYRDDFYWISSMSFSLLTGQLSVRYTNSNFDYFTAFLN